MKDHTFIDYANKLCLATTYEESFFTYNELTTQLGYKSLLYTYAPRSVLDNIPAITAPTVSVSESYNLEYLKQYSESHFEQTDYVVQSILQGNTSTLDWWEDCNNGQLNKAQKKILHIMQDDYRMSNGLTIPLPNGIKGVGVASLISGDKDRLFKKLKSETHSTLWTATKLFHNHVIANAYEYSTFIKPILSSLSKTEKQALKCLLDGLSVPQIAQAIFRSRGHTENLVRSIRTKIGGEDIEGKPRITKDQLIHYCGLMQIYNEL